MNKVLILGSTGSIGINTLNVIKSLSGEEDKFKIAALTANKNIRLLEEQINEFHPEIVAVKDEDAAKELEKRVGKKCTVLSGVDGLCSAAANCNYDILVGAMVGFAGFAPTVQAIKRGKRIALANKETLVVGGELITVLAKQYNAELVPVDSEHSAIFQCLVGETKSEIKRLILTASGGPFLNTKKELFESVTVNQALKHPKWNMGKKITIDSATLMNKGLEVIEAHWLFGLSKNKIDVLIHPQSIIHSLVEFIDGSIKAQLSIPDMKFPIQYALTFPARMENDFPKTDFSKIGILNFLEPDFDKFECLKIAFDALNDGGLAPCILNAANEIAVDKFLSGQIKFSKIPAIINKALDKFENHKSPDMEMLFEYDRQTREFVYNLN
jgi:1-deoxy-D-xylulose-5-phosphate reductoisomerase